MAGLQPLLIFKSEVARVNELYWSSTYAYNRTCQFLSFLESTGNYTPDPLVKEVWGAKDYALDRVSKTNLGAFSNILMVKNSEALRINSILHLCSAFENALSGYYFLCSLYEGRKGDANYIGDDIPLLLKTTQTFESRRKSISRILESTASPLKGKYAERLKVFNSAWGVALFSGSSLSRLNGYYKTRHKIAHDQGLGAPDNPEYSAEEILRNRVVLTDAKWKQMIHDFQEVLVFLDEQVAINIVTDKGLALAVYRTLRRDGPLMTEDLMKKLTKEWRLGQTRKDRLHKLVLILGGRVTQVNGNKYKVSLPFPHK
ncbi:hypothetical protein IFR09_13230 [Pseudomonas syringae]|nr:hypothetical protein [Pseudomonas syringae]MBD8789555.1 hypothetical protein [Pseudomonas syringae]MBD8800744.1 hypothetical protein [Pseudomonas syringae]MBD8812125.1 hypothetical protein [Pseudomonas syringae]